MGNKIYIELIIVNWYRCKQAKLHCITLHCTLVCCFHFGCTLKTEKKKKEPNGLLWAYSFFFCFLLICTPTVSFAQNSISFHMMMMMYFDTLVNAWFSVARHRFVISVALICNTFFSLKVSFFLIATNSWVKHCSVDW